MLESIKLGFQDMVNSPKPDGLEWVFMLSYWIFILCVLLGITGLMQGGYWVYLSVLMGIGAVEMLWLMYVSLVERVKK